MSISRTIPSVKRLTHAQEDHWIPLSDLMTGLMMIFMLVAIIFMVQIEREAKTSEQRAQKATQQATQIRSIASVYNAMRDQLYRDLQVEFSNDFPKWGAQLFPDLSLQFRFKEPDVLFDNRDDRIKPRFKEILTDFFPRYLKVLTGEKYKNSIEEIRIEGHTSSLWNDRVTSDQAYFLNMALSQSRTRSVLEYALSVIRNEDQKAWARVRLTANGLSSSKPILQEGGTTENYDASRRVEFRVRTNADEQISEILKAVPE